MDAHTYIRKSEVIIEMMDVVTNLIVVTIYQAIPLYTVSICNFVNYISINL